MLAPPSALVDLLKPWSDFYGHSKLAETIVVFVHVGGLLLAGGVAIATDRLTLNALSADRHDRLRFLDELGSVHRWVLTGLTLIVLSGVAIVLSDIETFWGSPIYWTKMLLVVALLLNGFRMTRAETALAHDDDDASPGWRTLHRTAVASLGLWFSITALGIALVNFS